jgi:hypothetical protein
VGLPLKSSIQNSPPFFYLKNIELNIHKLDEQLFHIPCFEYNWLRLQMSIAFILLIVLAIQYDQREWRKKVQRVRNDHKVLSCFSFAYKLIDNFIYNQISFKFSFQFSKNSMGFFPKTQRWIVKQFIAGSRFS